MANKELTKSVQKGLWYISISRNALIVLVTSAVSYNWINQQEIPFLLSGKVEPGVPSFEVPPFSMQFRNETMGFVEMCSELGTGIIVIPLVAVLANIAIAKSFCEYIVHFLSICRLFRVEWVDERRMVIELGQT